MLSPEPRYSLGSTAFAAAFPFHFAIDPELRVVQVGRSLTRAVPALSVGASLLDVFEVRTPAGPASFARWRECSSWLFVLAQRDGAVLLRGQFFSAEQPEILLFLGSPWISTPETLLRLGLALSDFAPHDGVADFVHLMQSHLMAMDDVRRLAERVEAQSAASRVANGRLAEREALLRAVVDTANDGIALLDQGGAIVEANPALEALLGTPSSSLVGRPLRSFIVEPSAPAPELDHAVPREVSLRSPGGEAFPVLLSLAELSVEGRRGFTAIVHEIRDVVAARSELRRYATELEATRDDLESKTAHLQGLVEELNNVARELDSAKRRAEDATRAKTTFLASMSHEIRTPMNAVIGMAEVLAGTPLTAEQRGYIETMRAGGRALLDLIDEILDFSRIEAGHLDVDKEPFFVRSTITEAFAIVGPGARRKGLETVLQIDDDVPDAVRGDRGKLRQIALNLLSNAVKFTDRGRVTLEATCARASATPRLVVRVSDTGVGIAPERLDSVFEPFEQADASTARRFGGTGLGLAISRALTEAMGGTLGVTSSSSRGTTFELSIPIELSDAPRTIRRPTPRPMPDRGRRLRVLVVEDDAVNREVARRLLERLDANVTLAENGVAAMGAIGHATFDLALLDMHLPDVDGLTLARRIQTRLGPRTPYLVALTADARREARAAGLAAGLDDYLTKPVTTAELASVLASVREGVVPGLSMAPSSARGASIIPLVDVERVKVLCEGDDALLQELVELFDDDARERIASLRAAVAASNLVAIQHLGHSLKGIAANIGARHVMLLATEIEDAARLGNLALSGARAKLLDAAVQETTQALRSWRTEFPSGGV
jgi:PAS domain S-box-containing protein